MKRISYIVISVFLSLFFTKTANTQSNSIRDKSGKSLQESNKITPPDSVASYSDRSGFSEIKDIIRADHRKNGYQIVSAKQESIPNAFTPNGDQYNDVFLKSSEVRILDRWGKELYHGLEGWDGKYNGNNVAAGTYLFIQSVRDSTGKLINTNKGTVLLIRE